MGERSGGSKGWPARAFRSPSHSSRPEEAQWDLLTGKFPGPAGIGVMAGMGGRGMVRVGLLGLSGAGACPNLLQRRPGPGSAVRRSAEYQRFSSGVSSRSGPLQQIWTNGAVAGPCADGGLGDRPGARASPAPTGCRDVHFALERCILPSRGAVRSARSSAKCTSREQNAHLDEHRADPPPPPRADPARVARSKYETR